MSMENRTRHPQMTGLFILLSNSVPFWGSSHDPNIMFVIILIWLFPDAMEYAKKEECGIHLRPGTIYTSSLRHREYDRHIHLMRLHEQFGCLLSKTERTCDLTQMHVHSLSKPPLSPSPHTTQPDLPSPRTTSPHRSSSLLTSKSSCCLPSTTTFYLHSPSLPLPVRMRLGKCSCLTLCLSLSHRSLRIL